ncbi:MAG: hypothetical protein HGA49_12085 [Eubacteriaceae bacterium]|nr:hypothetical protein [Eubacteriaceae bacterium]
MNDTYKDIDEIIAKLNELKPHVDKLSSNKAEFDKLIKLRFFDAFLNIGLLEKIIGRLDKNEYEKDQLATHLSDIFTEELKNNSIKTFFIESGSTLAYFARKLSEIVYANDVMPSVITNNFFAQTMLLELFPNLLVTSGYLRKDYLSYLPFSSETIRDKDDKKPSEKDLVIKGSIQRKDRIAFKRLDSCVSQSDIIYMTASTFGFLVGPSTRSRDNAIFKYCLLNNTAKRKIRFCIAEPNVFRRSEDQDNPRYVSDPGKLNSDDSIFKHFKDCCFIFDIQLMCDSKNGECTKGICKIKRKNIFDNTPANMELAIDGTIFTEQGRLCREKKDCDCQDTNAIYFHSAPAELGLKYMHGYMGEEPIFGCCDTWLNYLESQVDNIEIIIGCHGVNITNQLVRVVEEANKFIKSAGYHFQYKKRDVNNVDILHLDIE